MKFESKKVSSFFFILPTETDKYNAVKAESKIEIERDFHDRFGRVED